MIEMSYEDHQEVPDDRYGYKYFCVDMVDFGNEQGPMLRVNVPERFIDHKGKEFKGGDVLEAPIQKVLEDYISSVRRDAGGIEVPEFCAWLRSYADRLEAEAATEVGQDEAKRQKPLDGDVELKMSHATAVFRIFEREPELLLLHGCDAGPAVVSGKEELLMLIEQASALMRNYVKNFG